MLRPFLLSLVLCASAPSFAIYKCEAGGKVSYSDIPCTGGKVLDIDGAPAADAAKAARQAERERNTLKRLEEGQRKQTAKDERAIQRNAKVESARRKKCTSLERRQRLAEEDARQATGKSAERAKHKARRIADEYQDECKSQRELAAIR